MTDTPKDPPETDKNPENDPEAYKVSLRQAAETHTMEAKSVRQSARPAKARGDGTLS
jgi:hypothetical protein